MSRTSSMLIAHGSITTSSLLPSSATPIDPSGWPDRFPAKEHCSRCGLCETSFVSKVTEACAFLGEGMARMDSLEHQVHGRGRRLDDMVWSSSTITGDNNGGTTSNNLLAEEARFGVLAEPVQLARGSGIRKAQWTGCVTGIALSMLEAGKVDAVVCIAGDWSGPTPILARTSDDVLRGRGVKPALAPSLAVLDEIKGDPTIRRLLFCGVGCAVQAFRAVEKDLGLEEVYVLGTNCADNSPTPRAAEEFIENGVKVEGKVRGYEFMQDFRVHVKTDDGKYIKKPYFVLPGTIAEASIAPSCLACFDYTNGLADVVVGYMGAPLEGATMEDSYQTLTIRNTRGREMVGTAKSMGRIEVYRPAEGTGKHESMAMATVGSDSIVQKMVGKKVAEQGMPGLLGELMATIMTAVGPKGIAFARYSIDYHVLRNYLHIVSEWGKDRADVAMPEYAKDIVSFYRANNDNFAELERRVNTEL